MKIIVIAAIARNGVIGRSKKPCGCCLGSGWDSDLYASHECNTCGGDSATGKRGTGFVPCNELPWPPGTYPEDMTHFRQKTEGHAVVMGRNTWESIPRKFRPLSGRTNVVVSKTLCGMRGYAAKLPADVVRAESLLDAEQICNGWNNGNRFKKLYVIGGARFYAEALPIADELDLTLVGKAWDGDVKFPRGTAWFDVPFGGLVIDNAHSVAFKCVSRESCPTNPDLTFTRWVRR